LIKSIKEYNQNSIRPSVVLDENGDVVGETRYTPFGEERDSTGSMFTDRMYTGQREVAGIGLYFYNARFYDPGLGRFISPDSIVPGAGNPQALNRYSYGLNNPINSTDPTGHWGLSTNWSLSGFYNNIWGMAGNMIEIQNLNGKMPAILDNLATACDTLALAIDAAVAVADITAAVIGGTSGVVIAGAAAGPEATPITGPGGAAIGAILTDLALKPLTIAANILATVSTVATAESDLFTGENNFIGSLKIGSSGMSLDTDIYIGRDTYTSGYLTTLGWAIPYGGLSMPVQGVALANDFDFYNPDLQNDIGKALTTLSDYGLPGTTMLGEAFETVSFISRALPNRLNLHIIN
jgi:RHS repeat-associated protein